MGLFTPKKDDTISAQQALAARPMRLVDADVEEANDGGARLKVRLRHSGVGRWLLRMPEGSTKTFELDPMGLLVWNSCDGKTSVQQIIRKLAKQYNLNLREAEVPTKVFLRTLTRKGLIGISVKKGEEKAK